MGDSGNDGNDAGRPAESSVVGKPFAKGKSGNEGGLTKHQAERRSALRAWLFSDPITTAWKEATLKRITDGDKDLLKWAGDHLLGKAKETLEVSGDTGASVWLDKLQALASREDVVAFLKGDDK